MVDEKEKGKINRRKSGGKEVNSDLSFDFALIASLSEGGVGRLFLAANGRSVALYGAETAPYRARGKSRGRTEGQLSLTPLRGELPRMNRVPQTGQRYKSSQGYQKFIQ